MIALGAVQRRQPLRLGLGNLYILPTRFGVLWLAGMALLQVVAIQLQSNGALLLSFLMLGLFLLALLLTHANLQGLELRCAAPSPAFAGEQALYPLQIRCPQRCEGLRLRLGSGQADGPRCLEAGWHRLAVAWWPERRGRQRPGCLLLSTTAPLGLFVCWTRWEPPEPQVILPAPLRGPVGRLTVADGVAPAAADPPERGEGGSVWHDLRPHRPEDGPGRLAWKQLAQGRGAHTKCFADPQAEAALLTAAAGIPPELALQHLCEAILRLHGEGVNYGLCLGGWRIEAGNGRAHRDRCLELLALLPLAAVQGPEGP